MNLTLVSAIALLVAWLGILFAVPGAPGWVHLLYAAGMTLVARRIIVGAPSFKS